MPIKNQNPENQKFSVSKISKRQKEISDKKEKLTKAGRRTKWAPVWVVLKKFGMGKKIHPSAITRHRRSWRRTKLHIKPRRQKKSHFK
jgi:ribosomal protein L39E